MRILFALPGFHRVQRGAEIALMSVADELALLGDDVTLMGAGKAEPGHTYRFVHVGAVARERFERMPKFPPFRGDTVYEEATFAAGLLARYRPADYDVTVTCSYPFVNWILRRPSLGRRAPPHVFVTQNGDWPARTKRSEFRFFGCDGLICINPDYFERNRAEWRATLIPNGLALDRFGPGPSERAQFGIPADRKIVLMVSALIESKRVADAIPAIAKLSNVHLVCAGDGPLREQIDALAARHLPDRFTRLTIKAAEMPELYRSANAFLHLSRDESFGNVYIEAMATGLPIVAHDQTRTRWIVGDDQFLCDAGDTTALSATIALALAAPPADPVKISNSVERFGWPLIARRYRSFLNEVVAATSGTSEA